MSVRTHSPTPILKYGRGTLLRFYRYHLNFVFPCYYHFIHTKGVLNMIRLFPSDMDGTLLNNKGYISDRTINAVKRLQKSGIHFIVNTRRDYYAAKRELDAASLSCDMICHSGACTYDVHGNGFHIASLPKSIAKQILTIFEKHGVFADIATEYGKTSIADKNTLLSYYNNSDYLQKARKYGHFTGYKN